MVYRASDLGLNVKSQIFTFWGKKKGEEKRAFKSSEEQGTSLYFFRIQRISVIFLIEYWLRHCKKRAEEDLKAM